MYKFKDENLQYFTNACDLLNQLEVKGIQNVNILGNSYNLLKKFFELLQKCEDEGIIIDNTKEEKVK